MVIRHLFSAKVATDTQLHNTSTTHKKNRKKIYFFCFIQKKKYLLLKVEKVALSVCSVGYYYVVHRVRKDMFGLAWYTNE